MLRTVKVRTKRDSIFFDLAEFGKTEDLITAAIGQDRLVPIYELMKSAASTNNLSTGPQVEMVDVSENNLRANLIQFALLDRFDRSLRPHRHEDGRLNIPMVCVNNARTCSSVCMFE